jgi:hypothetical protein
MYFYLEIQSGDYIENKDRDGDKPKLETIHC